MLHSNIASGRLDLVHSSNWTATIYRMADRGRFLFLCFLTSGLLSLLGCAMFNPERQYWVYGGPGIARVSLITDTPAVRALLSELSAHQGEKDRRSNLLAAVAGAPGFLVPAKSYCTIVEDSQVRCGSDPVYTVSYRLVRITSGPSRGREGWTCGPTQLYP